MKIGKCLVCIIVLILSIANCGKYYLPPYNNNFTNPKLFVKAVIIDPLCDLGPESDCPDSVTKQYITKEVPEVVCRMMQRKNIEAVVYNEVTDSSGFSKLLLKLEINLLDFGKERIRNHALFGFGAAGSASFARMGIKALLLNKKMDIIDTMSNIRVSGAMLNKKEIVKALSTELSYDIYEAFRPSLSQ